MKRRIVTGIKHFSGRRREKKRQKRNQEQRIKKRRRGWQERCKTRTSGTTQLISEKERRNRDGVRKHGEVHAIIMMFGWGKKKDGAQSHTSVNALHLNNSYTQMPAHFLSECCILQVITLHFHFENTPGKCPYTTHWVHFVIITTIYESACKPCRKSATEEVPNKTHCSAHHSTVVTRRDYCSFICIYNVIKLKYSKAASPPQKISYLQTSLLSIFLCVFEL